MGAINGGMSMLQGFMDYRYARKAAGIQRGMQIDSLSSIANKQLKLMLVTTVR